MDRILEILLDIRPDSDFCSSTDFIADRLLDSLDIMALIAELEEQYRIKVPVTEIIPENYQSIDAIASLARKCGGVL